MELESMEAVSCSIIFICLQKCGKVLSHLVSSNTFSQPLQLLKALPKLIQVELEVHLWLSFKPQPTGQVAVYIHVVTKYTVCT